MLIIFVKYPEPGKVKSRLAKSIGVLQAAEIYRCFTETLIANLKHDQYERVIFYYPQSKCDEFRQWLGEKEQLIAQEGSNLGERLTHAFASVFKQGTKQAVVVGTDSPLLDNRIILDAFKKLKENDCVIGPAHDGGYYLLGLSSLNQEIFKGIDWGTNQVFRQTSEIIGRLGIKTAILKPGFDIDTGKDLIKLRKDLYAKPDLGEYSQLRKALDILEKKLKKY